MVRRIWQNKEGRLAGGSLGLALQRSDAARGDSRGRREQRRIAGLRGPAGGAGDCEREPGTLTHADAEVIGALALLMAGERSSASFHHIVDGLGDRAEGRATGRHALAPSNNQQAFERAVLDFLAGR